MKGDSRGVFFWLLTENKTRAQCNSFRRRSPRPPPRTAMNPFTKVPSNKADPAAAGAPTAAPIAPDGQPAGQAPPGFTQQGPPTTNPSQAGAYPPQAGGAYPPPSPGYGGYPAVAPGAPGAPGAPLPYPGGQPPPGFGHSWR